MILLGTMESHLALDIKLLSGRTARLTELLAQVPIEETVSLTVIHLATLHTAVVAVPHYFTTTVLAVPAERLRVMLTNLEKTETAESL